MQRILIGAGALMGMMAVAMAALAAHALGGLGATRLAMVVDAIRMQGWHALALLGTGVWVGQLQPGKGRTVAQGAGAAFLVGGALFCLGVYGFALEGWPVVALAPMGGSMLMLGWAALFVSALLA